MIEASTMTGQVVYSRIESVTNSVNEYLRSEVKKQSDNIDWDTETITLEFHKGDMGCEDRLKVTLSVKEKEVQWQKNSKLKD